MTFLDYWIAPKRKELEPSLREKFLETEVIAGLEEAIALHRSALDLRPPGHSDRPTLLNHLANCVDSRFEKVEAAADLDELISLRQAILDLHPGPS
ncbi:hypothetical protein SCLCIDRAFT_31997 [Scleroderma citrinum Foug A]|uniref:Uncharacterized protein n=1 Tax=Scleroderma citrinum Foug A TaxID=1036808 RepID=A0A0C2ZKY1_9AGAM|nr:hypothetical protein SCLCIDRAFT_31997 [Scleroderma citrinum Foug A]